MTVWHVQFLPVKGPCVLRALSARAWSVQVTGEMDLEGGGRIIMRGFGRFNISLWDEVCAASVLCLVQSC